MVTIRILPNDSSDHFHVKESSNLFDDPYMDFNTDRDENFTIVGLAKACAATQIQAVYRGVKVRRRKYERFTVIGKTERLDVEYHQRVQNAVLRIQRFCRAACNVEQQVKAVASDDTTFSRGCDVSIQTIHGYCDQIDNHTQTTEIKQFQVQDTDNKSEVDDTLDKRKEIVKLAYDSCQSNVLGSIKLNGFEVLNVLQAMSVLGYREYEILLKTLLNFSGERTKFGQSSNYIIRLQGDIEHFENDINSAWTSLIKKAMDLSPGSAGTLRKKGNRLKFNSSSNVARSHLQHLIDLGEECLLVLEQNENIITYDKQIIFKFLSCIGLEKHFNRDGHSEWTVIEYLGEALKIGESSFVRTKTKAALEVVQYVLEWEKASQMYQNTNSFRLIEQLMEKDSLITKLKHENMNLCQQINTMADEQSEKENENKENIGNMNVPLTEKEHDYNEERPFTNDKKKNNYKRSTVPKSRQTRLRRKDNQKRMKQESVNCVEIKFSNLFEKEKKKVSTHSEKLSSTSTSKKTTRKKKADDWHGTKIAFESYSNSRDEPSNTAPSSLAQTIAKAKSKRSNHTVGTKLAWSASNSERNDSSSNKACSTSRHEEESNNEFFRVLRNKKLTGYNKGNDKWDDVRGDRLHSKSLERSSADERFNHILEKLRKTAVGLEP